MYKGYNNSLTETINRQYMYIVGKYKIYLYTAIISYCHST